MRGHLKNEKVRGKRTSMQVRFSGASKHANAFVRKWSELCRRASMRTIVMPGQNLNAKRDNMPASMRGHMWKMKDMR